MLPWQHSLGIFYYGISNIHNDYDTLNPNSISSCDIIVMSSSNDNTAVVSISG